MIMITYDDDDDAGSYSYSYIYTYVRLVEPLLGLGSTWEVGRGSTQGPILTNPGRCHCKGSPVGSDFVVIVG